MALKKGIVVATHPEDNSVDILMADGRRLIGVQVMTGSASKRSGTVDLPEVTPKADKWDISGDDEQEMIAVVDTCDGTPIVTGFLFPQVNQILSRDGKKRISRHQSDLAWMIDGDGNAQLNHPSGAFISLGESEEPADMAGANADGNATFDRNTEKRVNVVIGLAGNKVHVVFGKDGDMKVTLERDYELNAKGKAKQTVEGTFDIEAKGAVTIKTQDKATVQAEGDVDILSKGKATITAPGGTVINSPLVRVNGEVSARDFHKG